MEKLDDEKLFFTQNEITVLDVYKTKLDDEITGKAPMEFYNRSTTVYKTVLKRTDSILKVLLAKPFDFSKPDNITWPFTTYAVSAADLSMRWQRFLKWRVLENMADKLAGDGKTISETIPTGLIGKAIR